MTIKRYAYDFLDGLNADKDGLLVSYADYLALAEQVRQLTEQRDAVVAESNINLQGAARELNTSWMMHTTMLGAQAALLCISQGDIKSARDWLEGTTDEAFAYMPADMTPAGLQAWFDGNMVSEGGRNGFLTYEEGVALLRQRAPATSAILDSLRAEGVDQLATFAGEEYQRCAKMNKAEQRKWKGIVHLCVSFARQLRESKGANS